MLRLTCDSGHVLPLTQSFRSAVFHCPHARAVCCSDSAVLFPAPNLTIVSELQPILRAPMAIAVRIGANELAQK